ncbi:DUF2835 family protein [Oceaniserpentilla sp. 4NH20-0058]|uniref:DUF2835 family protein n=1 Tax=Oceaniserpentilla sp. 4NH20-0058 TaxID=3127660 RepID=UPI00334038FE
MNTIDVDIHISSDELQCAYEGVGTVFAHSLDGRSMRFPIKILWQFIGHDGIHGRFRIEYGMSGQFERVTRIA